MMTQPVHPWAACAVSCSSHTFARLIRADKKSLSVLGGQVSAYKAANTKPLHFISRCDSSSSALALEYSLKTVRAALNLSVFD